MMKALALAVMALAPETATHRVTGLFTREREADLREAVKRLDEVELTAVDFDRGEATFSYDPAKLFKGVKEKDRVQRFDQLLKQASSHTFGIRTRCETPWEKLVQIEIPVAGLDCRGCELAAYEAVAKIDGVEQATASFREGRVTARLDPSKTGRDALVEALKKRNVAIKSP